MIRRFPGIAPSLPGRFRVTDFSYSVQLHRQQSRFYSPRVPPRAAVRVPTTVYPADTPHTWQDDLARGSKLINSALESIIKEPVLVIERQLEIGSIFLGIEQGRLFKIFRPDGTPIGHMQEDDLGFSRVLLRQITRLHRPFTVRVFDNHGNHALTIRRPFSFINSHIRCLTGKNDSQVIGESQQEWHLWRRRYNLYLQSENTGEMDQFGRVDAPFLSFAFPVQDAQGRLISTVDRNWTGIGREIFTDTGVYVLRYSADAIAQSLGFDSQGASTEQRELSLPERVVTLATAVSVDFDYFSRHSDGGPPVPIFYGDV